MPLRSRNPSKNLFSKNFKINPTHQRNFWGELHDFDPTFGYVGKRLMSFQINKNNKKKILLLPPFFHLDFMQYFTKISKQAISTR